MTIDIARIRNVGFVGHGGVGKTSLVEAILFRNGMTSRLGRVDDGTATTDFDPEEIKRKISINIGVAHCDYRDHRFNFVDMPGYGDFIAEARAGLRVVEGAVLVVDAVAGVEVQTEKVSKFAQEYGLPAAGLRQPDGPRAGRLRADARVDPAAAEGPVRSAPRADRPGDRVPGARGRPPDEGLRAGRRPRQDRGDGHPGRSRGGRAGGPREAGRGRGRDRRRSPGPVPGGGDAGRGRRHQGAPGRHRGRQAGARHPAGPRRRRSACAPCWTS